MSTAPKNDYLDIEWQEVAAAVFAARGIKTGLWQFAVRLQFAAATAAWRNLEGQDIQKPTGMVAVEGIALRATTEPGPMVFDASHVGASTKRARRAPAKRFATKA